MLSGTVGVLALVAAYELLGIFPRAPLWFTICFSVISGFSGFSGLVNTSCFAYLADTVVDKNKLTIRMTYFSASYNFAVIVASLIGSFIADKIPMFYYNLLAMGCLSGLLIYIVLRISHISPVQMKQMCIEKTRVADSSEAYQMENREKTTADIPRCSACQVSTDTGTKRPFCVAFVDLITNAFSLMGDTLRTYTKPRKGHRRIYLILSAMTFVAYVACVVEMHNSVTAMYTYRRPLSWTPGQLARWRLVEGILKLFGKVVGINIFKRLLNFHETTIILISLTSIIAEAVIIGLADTTWKMYMAAGAATFGYFGLPTYKALVTQMVAADEVGKAMSAFGMGQELHHSNTRHSSVQQYILSHSTPHTWSRILHDRCAYYSLHDNYGWGAFHV